MDSAISNPQKLSLVSSILVVGVTMTVMCILMSCKAKSNHTERDKGEIPSMVECEKAVLAWLRKLPPPLVHGRTKKTTFSYKVWLSEGQNLPRVEEALIRWLKPNYEGVERGDVAYALGWLGGKDSVLALIDALASEDLGLRIEATAALGRIGDSSTFKPVSAQLQDDNLNVRANACIAIARLDPKRAKKLLMQALSDESDFVREIAERELQRLEKKGDTENKDEGNAKENGVSDQRKSLPISE